MSQNCQIKSLYIGNKIVYSGANMNYGKDLCENSSKYYISGTRKENMTPCVMNNNEHVCVMNNSRANKCPLLGKTFNRV